MKFTYRYMKMPAIVEYTRILEIFVVENKEVLSCGFLNYDTTTINGEHYKLPDGKLIVILLITKNHLWTTTRAWTEGKEQYYREKRGKLVRIDIEEKLR